MSGLIDTHMHLDALSDGDEGAALVDAAVARGVRGIVSIGVDPRLSQDLRGRVPEGLAIKKVLGLHPQEVRDEADVDDALAALERALDNDRDGVVCGIGETGLDARPGKGNAGLHEDVFRRHLRVARARDLPVVLHCVRRDGRLLDVLDEVLAEEGGGEWRGVWHGFTGSKDTMTLAVKRGLHIALGFQVLDERSRRVREAVPHIPDDRLLIETDAPPLPPERIVDVVAAVAALRGVSAAHVAAVSAENARRLFGF